MHLSVALDRAGWHPAAWREPRARPAELLTARYWVDLIQEAERGLLDFVTIEDGLSLQSTLHILGDLVVFIGPNAAAAAVRKDRLDGIAGASYESDAAIFTGTAAELADLLQEWQRAGLAGFRLRSGAIPEDLEAITTQLVPELQHRGAFRHEYEARTLRGLLGLGRPANRYASVAATAAGRS